MSSLIFDNWQILFLLIPFLITYFIYRFVYIKKHDEKQAMQRAVNYSTIFYIIGVLYIIHYMFESYFIGYILIGLISLLGLILIKQWKNGEEVVLFKGIKVLWRLCFLLFLISYISLLLFQIVQFIYLNFF